MERMFRLLRADEIEVRISQITSGGIMLLLYKDARCDQTILDETVGPMRWQRHHSRDNKNCIVSIYDNELKQWVEKEDTGTESNTEAEKGLASDSFKRACFNWGIGRELYTAPDMWFPRDGCVLKAGRDGKEKCYDNLVVSEIQYDDKNRISYVKVFNNTTQKSKSWGMKRINEQQSGKEEVPAKTKAVSTHDIVYEKCKKTGISPDVLAGVLREKTFEDLTEKQFVWLLDDNNWNKIVNIISNKVTDEGEQNV